MHSEQTHKIKHDLFVFFFIIHFTLSFLNCRCLSVRLVSVSDSVLFGSPNWFNGSLIHYGSAADHERVCQWAHRTFE